MEARFDDEGEPAAMSAEQVHAALTEMLAVLEVQADNIRKTLRRTSQHVAR